jgi:hypothetical protein
MGDLRKKEKIGAALSIPDFSDKSFIGKPGTTAFCNKY